jgi:rhodanese-related sulfurtransferase
MKQIVEHSEAFIFDTRFHRDFQRGAIPGAVNLSINSNLAERKNILRGVDKSARIVLYCQSAGCGFADVIASFLKFNGYRNISLFRGGYREWTAYTHNP